MEQVSNFLIQFGFSNKHVFVNYVYHNYFGRITDTIIKPIYGKLKESMFNLNSRLVFY